MIAVARVTVNHDGRGGIVADPLAWDQGGRKKARKLAIGVNVDLPLFPPGFLSGPWIQVHGGHIPGADVAAWPCSVGILCRFTSFLGTLPWPTGPDDIGHFGVSFLELLILFEQWAGHRLLSGKVAGPHVGVNRSVLIPSVPVSEGIEIRHGCQFNSSLVRALAKLPGGIGRFLPCRVWLSYVQVKLLMGSRQGHQNPVIISALTLCVGVSGYPKGSASELLDGTLKLRHCTTLFTMRFLLLFTQGWGWWWQTTVCYPCSSPG